MNRTDNIKRSRAEKTDAASLKLGAIYIDTVEFFTKRHLSSSNKSALRHLHPKMRLKTPKQGEARWWREFIIINRPCPEALTLLSRLDPGTYSMSRVDVAFDFIEEDEATRMENHEFIRRCLVQKWHGARRADQCRTTCYSAERSAPRNIAIYSDQPSKPLGVPCNHLEYRFQTVRTLRSLGLDTFTGLLQVEGIDPIGFLSRQSKFMEVDTKKVDVMIERMTMKSRRHRYFNMRDEEIRKRAEALFLRANQDSESIPATLNDLRAEGMREFIRTHRSWSVCLRDKFSWNRVLKSPMNLVGVRQNGVECGISSPSS